MDFILTIYLIAILSGVIIIAILIINNNIQPIINQSRKRTEADKKRKFLEFILLAKVIDNELLIQSVKNENESVQSLPVALENTTDEDCLTKVNQNENYDIFKTQNIHDDEPKCTVVDIESPSDPPIIRKDVTNRSNHKSELSSSSCSICLSDYNVGETVVYSDNEGCNHSFHMECIIPWLMMSRTSCPNCRRDFLNLNAKRKLYRVVYGKLFRGSVYDE